MYTIFHYFAVYSFIGWIMETCYVSYKTKRFVNRGFLNGPFCPVYGFGALIIIIVLTPVKNDAFLLFLGGIFLTSVLEYLTGFVLETSFNTKWWDYSNRPFNLKGRICLKFSVIWGILAAVTLTTLHPFISFLITRIPEKPAVISAWFLFVYFLMDLAFTINSAIHLNIRLHRLSQLSGEIKERINTIKTVKIPESVAEMHKKIDILSIKYEELISKRDIQHSRLLDAFPGLKSMHFNDTLNELKERIKSYKNREKK